MWFMPTMNRPGRCQLALDSMIHSGITTPGIVFVNGPQQAAEYRALRLPESWAMIQLDHNRGICGALNLAFTLWPDEPWYGLVCDDELVFTHGFDQTLVSQAGRWNIAHGNDGWRSSYRLWTYVVFGGDLIRTTGYWALPGLFHWFFDDHWEVCAAALKLKRWCQDVRTEHRHVDAGTAPDDLTYQTGRSKAGEDKKRFELWKRSEWPTLRERLKRAMLNPKPSSSPTATP